MCIWEIQGFYQKKNITCQKGKPDCVTLCPRHGGCPKISTMAVTLVSHLRQHKAWHPEAVRRETLLCFWQRRDWTGPSVHKLTPAEGFLNLHWADGLHWSEIHMPESGEQGVTGDSTVQGHMVLIKASQGGAVCEVWVRAACHHYKSMLCFSLGHEKCLPFSSKMLLPKTALCL